MVKGSDFVSLVGYSGVIQSLRNLEDQVGSEPVYLVGSNKEYGVFLEFGTSKMQAYPWLRPALKEFENRGETFLKQTIGASVEDADSTDEVVQLVALALEARMSDNADANRNTTRSPGVESGHPKRVTGELVNSIQAIKVQ